MPNNSSSGRVEVFEMAMMAEEPEAELRAGWWLCWGLGAAEMRGEEEGVNVSGGQMVEKERAKTA